MADPTLDEILADAKAFLAKRTVADESREFAENLQRSGQIIARGPDETVGKVLGRTAKAAAIPAAFLSGPVGGAATAYWALNALNEARQDPTALNVGMAGLSAIPAVKALRTLRGGLRGGKTAATPPLSQAMYRAFKGVPGMEPVPRGVATAISHTDLPTPALASLERSAGAVPEMAPAVAQEVAGFSDLPELSSSEFDRIGAQIARILARRGEAY